MEFLGQRWWTFFCGFWLTHLANLFSRDQANLHAHWAQKGPRAQPPACTLSFFLLWCQRYVSLAPETEWARILTILLWWPSWWQERPLHSHEEDSSGITLVGEEGTWHIPSLFLVSNYNERFFFKRVTRNGLSVVRKLVIFQCPQIADRPRGKSQLV